ncbi:MAG: hypothetical protein IJ916_11020 [Paludibacteraceae bacterium]|nr:hypothetical protein [Paludibacteraceae bacterium]
MDYFIRNWQEEISVPIHRFKRICGIDWRKQMNANTKIKEASQLPLINLT